MDPSNDGLPLHDDSDYDRERAEAVPALVLACKALLHDVRELGSGYAVNTWMSVRAAEAAIAKAEGRATTLSR